MGKISKVVVLGQKGCGKTAVIEQLIYGKKRAEYEIHQTVEDVYVATIESDRGIKERVRFYDTSGLEPKTREVPRHMLSFADGYVLVYSINNNDSFLTVDYIKRDIDRNKEKKEVTIIVLANKKDLDSNREVEQSIAQVWSNREKVKVFEVSALDRKSLIEPFVYLTSKLNPPPSKSTFPQLRKARPGNEQ